MVSNLWVRRIAIRIFGPAVGVLILGSCATGPEWSAIVPARDLPGEVRMNESAGRWGGLFVNVRFEDGEEAPIFVDTGCSLTILDKSLEDKVGKGVATTQFSGWLGKVSVKLYEAPKLSLNDTPLMLSQVGIYEMEKLPFPGAARGILGMDCLEHYCIQMDFQKRTVRFLDREGLNFAELGKSFDLIRRGRIPFIHDVSLPGDTNLDLMIDTGYDLDGHSNKTDGRRKVELNDAIWNGCNYTNVILRQGSLAEGDLKLAETRQVLGIRFLARHLVTFDFPGGKMYLKQTSTGPLAEGDVEAVAAFLKSLKVAGKLQGSSPEEKGSASAAPHLLETVAVRKVGNSDIYYYKVRRNSAGGWELERAWRTDGKDRMIEEYPIR